MSDKPDLGPLTSAYGVVSVNGHILPKVDPDLDRIERKLDRALAWNAKFEAALQRLIETGFFSLEEPDKQ